MWSTVEETTIEVGAGPKEIGDKSGHTTCHFSEVNQNLASMVGRRPAGACPDLAAYRTTCMLVF
jgi:hypothetical protein